jgi:glycosyltransferase involved in cell wall biosynthesis
VRIEGSADAAAGWLAEASDRLSAPLGAQGFVVSSGAEILVDAVNLATPSSLARWLWPYYKSYLIALRCDLVPIAQCDWEITPLHLEPAARRRSVLPCWPGRVTERISLRRSAIENVMVVTPLGASSGWLDQGGLGESIGRRQFTLRVASLDQPDFSEVDLLIADCAALRAAGRPYRSPLVAAWRAGVPALLVDTALERAERQSALDYIPVTSVADALSAIGQLRSHPQLYESMQRRAQERARSFIDGSVTAEWLRTLRDRLIPEANAVLKARHRHPVTSIARQAQRWFIQQSLKVASR